jgi:TetR/AcrR family transcriptional regulator, cholesterol catabolism regulator
VTTTASKLPAAPAEPDFAARLAAAMRAGRSPSPTQEAIFRAAVELFAKQGYASTSLRQIAERVKIETPSLYNHISSKQDLLFEMIQFATRELIAYVAEAVDRAGDDPFDRLWAATAAHVRFHCDHALQSRVGDTSLGALSDEHMQEALVLRRGHEDLFKGLLVAGMRKRVFRRLDVSISCFGILAWGTSAAQWYRPDGRLSGEEIGEIYADMAVRLVATPGSYERLFAGPGKRQQRAGGDGAAPVGG